MILSYTKLLCFIPVKNHNFRYYAFVFILTFKNPAKKKRKTYAVFLISWYTVKLSKQKKTYKLQQRSWYVSIKLPPKKNKTATSNVDAPPVDVPRYSRDPVSP